MGGMIMLATNDLTRSVNMEARLYVAHSAGRDATVATNGRKPWERMCRKDAHETKGNLKSIALKDEVDEAIPEAPHLMLTSSEERVRLARAVILFVVGRHPGDAQKNYKRRRIKSLGRELSLDTDGSDLGQRRRS